MWISLHISFRMPDHAAVLLGTVYKTHSIHAEW